MVFGNDNKPVADKLLTPPKPAITITNDRNETSRHSQTNTTESSTLTSDSTPSSSSSPRSTDAMVGRHSSSDRLHRDRNNWSTYEYGSERSQNSSNGRKSTGLPLHLSSPYLPSAVGGSIPRATFPISDDQRYSPALDEMRGHNSINMNQIYPMGVPIGYSSEESSQASVLRGQASLATTTNYNDIFDDSYYFGGFPHTDFLLAGEKEDDDYLHNPDPIADAELDRKCAWDKRSTCNLLGILFIIIGCLCLFIIVPITTYGNIHSKSKDQEYEILTDYTYPLLSAIRTDLVDPDTPESALTRTAKDGSEWKLVFSDEFNEEVRTFYPGDNQFWEAPDIHYQATVDLDWYDPDALTTTDGSLQIRYDAFENHDLNYRSGMLQSWNKLCFTQGILEVSASLPGSAHVSGIWPGIWSMGNLARPGYLASSEGVWPYSYNSCDAGITPNQSSTDGISFLPGQKLNQCTCSGSDHPNPGVGRGAPELDAVEGSVDLGIGLGITTQSIQVAPYDIWYIPDYDFVEIHNLSVTSMNAWPGGPFQQALVGTSTLNPDWQEFIGVDFTPRPDRKFQNYGFEYLNDDDDGYVQFFIGDKPTYTVYPNTFHPDGNIDFRPFTKEPMSIIFNFGISSSWAYIDWAKLKFPMTMLINSVRIYQPEDQISITCDPKDYPTYDYIQDHLPAYYNANHTSWEMAGYKFPKNKLTGC